VVLASLRVRPQARALTLSTSSTSGIKIPAPRARIGSLRSLRFAVITVNIQNIGNIRPEGGRGELLDSATKL
jgi:hypothetical protein